MAYPKENTKQYDLKLSLGGFLRKEQTILVQISQSSSLKPAEGRGG